MNLSSLDTEDLSLAALNASTVRADWQRLNFGQWRYWEATQSEGLVWVYPDDQNDFCEEIGYELHELCPGPMMNDAYEIPDRVFDNGRDPSYAAAQLAHLPLCIVEIDTFDASYHLALTGGGMDFSWEICEAYIRLGYAPPTKHADLPAMAGRGESEEDQTIIAACQHSFEAAAERRFRGADRLEEQFA
jgi:hypothetical protein